jgi:phytoene desaturase
VRAVTDAHGRTEPFDAVASNADVVHTYAKLLRASPRGRSQGRRLARKRHSMSLFVVYFGLKTKHPQLRHHTILFGPRYRELIGDIFKGEKLCEDFSLYLHAPGATDPSLAPEGCDGFYVLSPVANLASSIDWAEEGPRYADRILDALERRAIPNLRRDLVTMRTFTPADFKTELNAHLGSAFSLEPILTQSAWLRVHNRDDVIRNLYFVGAGAHPGAGVPGVIGSARATAGVAFDDLRADAA